MKRFLSPVLAVLLSLLAVGCGNFSVRGAIETDSTIRGSVTSIQLGGVQNGEGETVQATFVTFFQSGTSTNVNFCGDQTALFSLEQTVSVHFNPGPFCATVIAVIILD